MVTGVQVASPRWKALYKTSGAVAVVLGVLFLAGVANVWFPLLEDNWLIKLFKLNAGLGQITFDAVYGVNPVDLSILALVSVTYLGLFAALRSSSRIWAVIAMVQPIMAIILFVATGLIGRSGVMGAALVISGVMLRSHIFSRATAFLGIVASVLLLIGDFGTTPDSRSTIMAVFLGVGYVPLVVWFFLVGKRLLGLGAGGVDPM